MKRTKKRLVVIADLHSGSCVGLTHPDWQSSHVMNDRTKRNKYSLLQRQCWDFYYKTIMSLKPIDILMINGDCIEGKDEKGGGTELIVTDRQDQAEMAADAIKICSADKIFMTYGTPYHVSSSGEDFENLVKEYVKAERIGSHEWLDINGKVFDFKHKVGSSGLPHTRFTAIAREKLWSVMWAERKEQPSSDVVVRSHVHYFEAVMNKDFLGITTPALQAMGTKYGGRQCTGTIDFGLLSFDIDCDGGMEWHAHLADISSQKAKAIKL